VQYYNLNDPFNANQGKPPQSLPEDLEGNDEEKKDQEVLSEGLGGGEDYDQEPENLPARFGWGGARVKGVHSMHTKTN
jgi:hypothetical protein